MKVYSLQKYRDKHLGKRIWICGSGPSLTMVDEKRIPKEDILIACNSATYHFKKMDYAIFTDEMANFSNWYLDLKNKPCKVILCNTGINKLKKNTIYLNKDFTTWKINRDDVNVIGGYDIIHCAVHIAYVMGASEIILCGVDLRYKTLTEKYPYSQDLIDEAPQDLKDLIIKGRGVSEDYFDGALGLSLGGWKKIVENNNDLPIKTISQKTNLNYYPFVEINSLYDK